MARDLDVQRVVLHLIAPCCQRSVKITVTDVLVGPDGATIGGDASHALALHVRYCRG